MSLEERGAQHDKIPGDKMINPIVDFAMRTWDYIVRPSADGASGPITLTLPRVAEARGRRYYFVCRNADGVNTVTITDDNDSECWLADIVFDGKCDRIILESDGMCWHPLGAGGGPGGWPGFDTTAGPGTTEPPTSAAPTTAAGQSTAAPTSAAPTSAAPTSAAPTTLAPTT